MSFGDPWALLLLLAIPPLLLLPRRRAAGGAAVGFAAGGLLEGVRPTLAQRAFRALPLLRALALALCVVALARPQAGVEAARIEREGIAIALVLDISSSMAARDLTLDDAAANRLGVVKRTSRMFVEGDGGDLGGRDGDLIALVSFARYGDALSPPSSDHEALLELLADVSLVSIPEEDGTAIGDAIALGLDRLREAPGKSKAMVLLTDGSNNAGETDPVEAAQAAAALGVRVYTIGAGAYGHAPMPMRTRSGGTIMVDSQVFIDEFTLERIADGTGGRYYRATDADALREIYAEIDRLERAPYVERRYQRTVEIFAPFLLAALCLAALEAALSNTRLLRIP